MSIFGKSLKTHENQIKSMNMHENQFKSQ